jgi:hypothetical protein
MSSGSSNSSILNMPDYGQGLAEALQTQTDALSGVLTGTPLQQIVEQYERPLRMSAAQIDNDVLRQTLLGGQVPIYKSVSSDNLLERRISQPGEGGQATQIDYGGAVTNDGRVVIGDGEVNSSIRDLQEILARDGTNMKALSTSIKEWAKTADLSDFEASNILKTAKSAKPGLQYTDTYFDGKTAAQGVATTILAEGILYNTTDVANAISKNYGTPEPIYKKNEDGTDFVVPKDEDGNFILEATNETEIPEGGVAADPGELTGYTRAGTGLVDMLGDTRTVQEFTTRDATQADVEAGLADTVGQSITVPTGTRQSGFSEDDEFLGLSALAEDIQRGNLSRQREADLADVERLSDRFQTVMEDYKPGTTSGLDDARLLLEQQRENLTGLREATQADVDAGTATAIGEMIQTGRGGPVTIPTASTYGGDITPSTMTAATVGAAPELTAGTSFTGSTVADPTTLSASTSYTPTVNVTGGTFNAGTSYEPSAGVTGGKFDAGTSYTSSAVADPLKLSAATSYKPSAEVTGETYKAAQAANPMELAAATSYKPSAGVTGDGYTATAELEGGNIGADPLRKALMAQAIAAADNGLSDREIAQIENAARARSTMMGRTFDQQSAIDEAQAIVSQDNRRRMENRGFAQQFLGQEADIQRSDLERGLQANIRNQDALNRAAEFGASQDMQAQLANQAATNQALQAGMTAGLSQEALAAQQAQAKAFADQAAANRALEFGASTSMDAQRLNQAATNQALSQGIQAGLSQEALSAQQAQAKALADASAANRASEFGIGAGLDQEARANQAALQAALANQQATNQAAQFGVSAGMNQQAQANQSALQAALANQAASNQAAQYGVGAGLQQEALGAQQAQAKAMADAQFAQQAASQGLAAGLEQDALRAQLGQQTNLAQAQMDQQANAFDADAAMRASQVNQAQTQQANQFGVGATMDAERLNEQLRQQGLGNYINAVGNLAQIEDSYTLDPFQALLGRGGGNSLQAGQGVFGQAGYGLNSGPQYLNPEAGLGYISQMAANDANMYAANVSANASRNAGLMGGLGAIGGGLAQGIGAAGSVGAFFCWVAREVYGPTNPAWLQFREWMFTESPNWFFNLYKKYGERFAQWISDKPRIKSIIRKWMDSRIGG